MTDVSNTSLKTTPLHALHTRLGARMAEFGVSTESMGTSKL